MQIQIFYIVYKARCDLTSRYLSLHILLSESSIFLEPFVLSILSSWNDLFPHLSIAGLSSNATSSEKSPSSVTCLELLKSFICILVSLPH